MSDAEILRKNLREVEGRPSGTLSRFFGRANSTDPVDFRNGFLLPIKDVRAVEGRLVFDARGGAVGSKQGCAKAYPQAAIPTVEVAHSYCSKKSHQPSCPIPYKRYRERDKTYRRYGAHADVESDKQKRQIQGQGHGIINLSSDNGMFF